MKQRYLILTIHYWSVVIPSYHAHILMLGKTKFTFPMTKTHSLKFFINSPPLLLLFKHFTVQLFQIKPARLGFQNICPIQFPLLSMSHPTNTIWCLKISNDLQQCTKCSILLCDIYGAPAYRSCQWNTNRVRAREIVFPTAGQWKQYSVVECLNGSFSLIPTSEWGIVFPAHLYCPRRM